MQKVTESRKDACRQVTQGALMKSEQGFYDRTVELFKLNIQFFLFIKVKYSFLRIY